MFPWTLQLPALQWKGDPGVRALPDSSDYGSGRRMGRNSLPDSLSDLGRPVPSLSFSVFMAPQCKTPELYLYSKVHPEQAMWPGFISFPCGLPGGTLGPRRMRETVWKCPWAYPLFEAKHSPKGARLTEEFVPFVGTVLRDRLQSKAQARGRTVCPHRDC